MGAASVLYALVVLAGVFEGLPPGGAGDLPSVGGGDGGCVPPEGSPPDGESVPPGG